MQALNYQLSGTTPRPQKLPSVKVDHNVSPALKLSAFYSYVGGSGQTSTDGLPTNITTAGFNTSRSSTARLNVDDSLRPSMLLHFGVGYVNTIVTKFEFPDLQKFDQKGQLGLTGAITNGFPQTSGLGNFSASGAPIGGMTPNFGSTYHQEPDTGEFTSSASLSWVKQSHTFKFGGSMHTRMEAFNQCQGGWGVYVFSGAQTGQPFGAGGVTLATTNGSPGLGFASFLLGMPNSVTVSPCTSVNWHDRAIAGYAQDNWKVTRRLTVELGTRYDLQNPPVEDRNRISSFSPTTPNPSAGNLPGAVLYQGYGPNTCNCDNLLTRYKFAFAPRIGVAYQLTPRTVIRAGWGFFFGAPDTFAASAPQSPSAGTGYDTITFSATRSGASALPNGLAGRTSRRYVAVLFDAAQAGSSSDDESDYGSEQPEYAHVLRSGSWPSAAREPIQCRVAAGGDPWNDDGGGVCGQPRRLASGLTLFVQLRDSGDPGGAWPESLQAVRFDASEFADRLGGGQGGRLFAAVRELPADHDADQRPASVPTVRRHHAYIVDR